MKLTIKQGSENYTCNVVTLKTLLPIEGADNIQLAVLNGVNIIVSKKATLGSTMLLFSAGTQLAESLCHLNNLYSNAALNANIEEKGFLTEKRRVKAIKLRGIISEGLLLPLEALKGIADYSKLEEGDKFTTLDNVEICEKYIISQEKSTKEKTATGKIAKESRLIGEYFRFHDNTSNLLHNSHKITPETIIGIHYKKHGTSAVYANIPVKKVLPWYLVLLRFLGVPIIDFEYDVIYSSRKVIKNKELGKDIDGGFYKEDIWGEVLNQIKHLIPKNWTIYGEIVGFLPSGKPIQGKYDYGCTLDPSKGVAFKFFPYKISITNDDGVVHYLSDLQIEEWCKSVGLEFTTTFFYYGKAKDLFPQMRATKNFSKYFIKYLQEKFTEKNCFMCVNKVPEEGIVLRIESGKSYEAYKLKSKKFILQESEEQEKEESNIEDNQ